MPQLAAKHDIELDSSPFESPDLTRVLYKPGHLATKSALLLKDDLQRFGVLQRARAFAGVVVYREATLLGGAYLEWALRRTLGPPIIYEFDGDWGSRSLIAKLTVEPVRAPWKTSASCRLASAVTVGSACLVAYAQGYNPDVTRADVTCLGQPTPRKP